MACLDDTTACIVVEIVEDGVMTMLIKLADAGYISLFSTNNIGAKYAYMLPDETFASIPESQRVLQKARMSIPRFR